MKKHKRAAGKLLLTVFSAILLANVFQSPVSLKDSIHEAVVIHSNDFSGEEADNIYRSFSDCVGFDNRFSNDFQISVIGDFHSTLTKTIYKQIASDALTGRKPVEVYRFTRRFLI